VVVLNVDLLLAVFDFVQWRLRDVDVTALDQQWDVAIEKRQQQSAYVAPVYVSIGVVSDNTAHAGNEIFITLDRKIVDVAVARIDFVDGEDRQRHQVTVDHLKIALA